MEKNPIFGLVSKCITTFSCSITENRSILKIMYILVNRHLLRVPIAEIKVALKGMQKAEESTFGHARMLMDKCRGLDRSIIDDDNGGLSKQVSVEDSFRRGTMTTKALVWKAMEELFVRLPKLLDERQLASPNPSQAFPHTIRLTVRVVDPRLVPRRRPYTTTSKQCRFKGKEFMKADEATRRRMLHVVMTPLLDTLVLQNPEYPEINITRMNIATTNFQDLISVSSNPSPQTRITFPASSSKELSWSSTSSTSVMPLKRDRGDDDGGKTLLLAKYPEVRMDEIDASVLAELPPDIIAEVRNLYEHPPKKAKRRTIDSFFHRKC
jgi:impB/mucB/samB family C-terminal domain